MDNQNQSNKGQNLPSSYVTFLPNKGNESAFLYKKTERLVAGTYLISDTLPENEPMRSVLRSQALRLLEDSMDLMYRSLESERKIVLDNLSSGVLELVALLEAGKISGLISISNTELIRDEFFGFLTALRNYVEKPSLPIFPPNFFADPEIGRVQLNENQNLGLKDKMSFHQQGESLVGSGKSRISTRNASKPGIAKVDKQAKKDSRRETIIKLLKNGKELTIKDFSSVIRDCSEKTIQRELMAMLSDGVLKRVGERRWSRYSLV